MVEPLALCNAWMAIQHSAGPSVYRCRNLNGPSLMHAHRHFVLVPIFCGSPVFGLSLILTHLSLSLMQAPSVCSFSVMVFGQTQTFRRRRCCRTGIVCRAEDRMHREEPQRALHRCRESGQSTQSHRRAKQLQFT